MWLPMCADHHNDSVDRVQHFISFTACQCSVSAGAGSPLQTYGLQRGTLSIHITLSTPTGTCVAASQATVATH